MGPMINYVAASPKFMTARNHFQLFNFILKNFFTYIHLLLSHCHAIERSMPYGRRSKRFSTRNRKVSRFYRRGIRRNPKLGRARVTKMVPFRTQWKSAIPRQTFVKFRYIDNSFTGDTTHLVPQTLYVFRGNSLFDPDQTGVGVQPYGYDAYTPLYAYYRVVASKITIYPHLDHGYAGNGIKLIIVPAIVTSFANTDPSDLMNHMYSQAMMINTGLEGQGNNAGKKLTNYCTTRKMYPAQHPKDVSFCADNVSNPALGWYWLVYFDQTDELTADADILFDVKIVYYSQLTYSGRDINES